MPQYLSVAEKIYKKLKERKEFSTDSLENLNTLIIEIRKEIKSTKLKLLYNFIDFEECLNKCESECKIKLDISLIPIIKNEGEFILWLAGFIQRITTDGKRKIPPIRKNIPPEFKYSFSKEKKKYEAKIPDYSKSEEMINSYFKSHEFMEIINKPH
ncbi:MULTISPECIES: hypothetical protein [Acinetobacter]|jgi:hypothetical protein|uniref:hypothetical protein n=1 Tax=Acinetobacter TaxID=469 RepID=UPI00019AE0E0|nr:MULTISPECIES: hypothetical protein [Acinetobacter]EEH69573.1 hypothetical protein HMPREF0023_0863 [Acinetobacter sp. ATCC 27244]